MNAILVRVGIDHAYGKWNAPADEASRRFVYVPIPEGKQSVFSPGQARVFREILPNLEEMARKHGRNLYYDMRFPVSLTDRPMHLDPDFEHLTYGDDGAARGSRIARLQRDDLLVFYAGLRGLQNRSERLIYALVGLYVIDEIVPAMQFPQALRQQNAHTRKDNRCATDIVVRARRGPSGRLRQYIPIGEYRDRAYRVQRDVLDAWGGLSVNDGYIQRSARPPCFQDAMRFYRWFQGQSPELIASNNE